jgi:mannose-1-phosphate guanylyltransferase
MCAARHSADPQLYAAILAGGVGTRLWPRSRMTQPKQFADITGAGRTMIQDTAGRLDGLVPAGHRYVITGMPYAALAAEQLPDIPAGQIIAEPFGRNTAPAIGLACVHLRLRDPDAIVAFLHSDQVIADVARFQTALRRARDAAQHGHIVTLGIEPTQPHTGYGYIQRGPELPDVAAGDLPVYRVQRFLEKPSRSVAEAFLAEGGYYWNGGIFVTRVDAMLGEIQRQQPQLYACLEEIDRSLRSGGSAAQQQAELAAAWQRMPGISIDHGVMEGAQQVAMVPLDAGWNDVGSWDALTAVLPQDATRNYVAKGEILAVDSQDNVVYCDKPVIVLIGVHDLVVVDSGDALLIGDQQQMQRVKEVVDQLRAQGRTDLL